MTYNADHTFNNAGNMFNLKKKTILLIGSLFCFAAISHAGGFYKWTDSAGVTHYADSPGKIPEQFRNQVTEGSFKERKKEKPPAYSAPISTADVSDSGADKKLKTYKIKYKAFGGSARRIIVQVTFNNSVTAPMIFDTGAPGLIISRKLAREIGLFKKDVGRFVSAAGGIGGRVPAIITLMDSVKIGEVEDKMVPTTITSKSISKHFEGLIGLSFMDNYSYRIDNVKRLLIIEEQPVREDRPGGHDRYWWGSTFRDFANMRTSWRQYRDNLKRALVVKNMSRNQEGEVKKEIKVAESQVKESEKLFRKLDTFASHHSVPMAWRRY